MTSVDAKTTVDDIKGELRSSYQRLTQAVAALRFWQARYVDDLKAAPPSGVGGNCRSFATRRSQAQAEYDQTVTAADAALASSARINSPGMGRAALGFSVAGRGVG